MDFSFSTTSCTFPIIMKLGIDVECIVSTTVPVFPCCLHTPITPCVNSCDSISSSSIWTKNLCRIKHLPFWAFILLLNWSFVNDVCAMLVCLYISKSTVIVLPNIVIPMFFLFELSVSYLYNFVPILCYLEYCSSSISPYSTFRPSGGSI